MLRKPVVFMALVLLGIGADLLSKKLVFDWLAGSQTWTYPIIPGVLQFNLAENPGVAFSLLAGRPGLIIGFTSLAVCFLLFLYARLRKTAPVLTLLALALLVIGATGNLVDRIKYSIVRDFIDFMPTLPVIGHWAIFNVADVCIVIGVGLFMIAELFLTPQPVKAASAQGVSR